MAVETEAAPITLCTDCYPDSIHSEKCIPQQHLPCDVCGDSAEGGGPQVHTFPEDPRPSKKDALTLTTRAISHEEALDIAHRLINSHFRTPDGARISIPARPDHDDDLLIVAYIQQQRDKDEPPSDAEEAVLWNDGQDPRLVDLATKDGLEAMRTWLRSMMRRDYYQRHGIEAIISAFILRGRQLVDCPQTAASANQWHEVLDRLHLDVPVCAREVAEFAAIGMEAKQEMTNLLAILKVDSQTHIAWTMRKELEAKYCPETS